MSKRDKQAATESGYRTASARSSSTADSVSRTHREQAANGKIPNSLVDPASYDGIRISRTRFEETPSGLFRLVKGPAMCISTYVDGSSSFGHTLVQQTISGLKNTFVVCSKSMPQYELWLLSGVFNDCEECWGGRPYFPLYRTQFEYDPKKIVDQLLSCVPNDGGCGNGGEDPQYAIFAEAFLTNKTITDYGLKSYAFFGSDEPMHDTLSATNLKRIFGDRVFETIQGNGFKDVNEHQVPTVKEAVKQMLETTHTFYIGLGDDYTRDRYGRTALQCWAEMLGEDRVIPLYGMSGEIVPYVQGVITGLTEGTINMMDVPKYLGEVGVSKSDASTITKAVMNVPVGAQAKLLSQLPHPLPKEGDLFNNKTDLWPIDPSKIAETTEEEPVNWL